MSGRGGVTQSPKGTKTFDGIGPDPDPRVHCFNAAGHWLEAKEPMHADIDTTKVNGVGPGLIFAKELLTLQPPSGNEIGLVPCAIGGTSMDEWLPDTVLYKKMVDRALKSVGKFPSSDGRIVRLRGLLWYQGESDTDSMKVVEDFPSKLRNFFTTFWNQIGAPQDFIIQQVQVTCRIKEVTKYVEQLRHAQLDVGAAMQNPRVWTVDASGLLMNDDGMHLTREAQYTVGRALAQQHIAIIAGSASPAIPWKCVPDAR